MEDLLTVYALPYNPARPVLCFDEKPTQMLDHLVAPIPMKPGKGGEEKVDHHYQRNGVCNLLTAVEPLGGRRMCRIEEHRTMREFAYSLLDLDRAYPDAEVIILVCDNLSTHTKGALYETFPPEEARRLAARFEFHYTPKRGSWLNMAEIEISVLARQCLSGRMASIEAIRARVEPWVAERNAEQVKISWQFTTTDAREKLGRHYKTVRNQEV
jgi:hypothetical protein